MFTRKFLNPKNELIFKKVFGSKQNKDILIHFLNDILGRESPITEVDFFKTNQDPKIAPHRVSIVDALCEDQNKEEFVVEMQLCHEPGFDRQALHYGAKTYCGQREDGMLYKNLKDVYCLGTLVKTSCFSTRL